MCSTLHSLRFIGLALLACVSLTLAACDVSSLTSSAKHLVDAGAETGFTVGGTVTGLTTGNSITLTNNGTDKLTLNANGAFTFTTKLANAATYKLTLSATTPTAQPCTSTYGAGTINATNVTSLNVFCGLPGGIGTFTRTNVFTNMDDAATVLSNGKVLVSGGYNMYSSSRQGYTQSVLYDPATGIWADTGPLARGRSSHTSTLLPNGKVLVSGGENAGALVSAELYDPAARAWTNTGSLEMARYKHTATLLPNGKVLVCGGFTGDAALASAELFDPVTGLWTTTGSLATARGKHTATLLPSGKVLVVGGEDLSSNSKPLVSAELYDPTTGVWAATGSLAASSVDHTATLLPNGKVLVVSDVLVDKHNYVDRSIAELYDSATGVWTTTGSPALSTQGHAATLLPNGKVLINSGLILGDANRSAELYSPDTGTWTDAGGDANWQQLFTSSFTTATLLLNGNVLIRSLIPNSENVAEVYWAADKVQLTKLAMHR